MNGNEKPSSRTGMGLGAKIAIVAALILIVAAARYVKNHQPEAQASAPPAGQAVATPLAALTPAPTPKAALPRLLDLGAGKCIPCRLMAPILEELKREYAGKLDVEFIDVWLNPDAKDQYTVNIIPTQIFFDAAGKELFRHEGFFAKEDILGKWQALGVPLRHDGVTTASTPQ